MDTHLPEYELYAIRYAERDARRSDHFIGGDPHDGPAEVSPRITLHPVGGHTPPCSSCASHTSRG
jgi:hypothetical protein